MYTIWESLIRRLQVQSFIWRPSFPFCIIILSVFYLVCIKFDKIVFCAKIEPLMLCICHVNMPIDG